jgi:hypothetical protein
MADLVSKAAMATPITPLPSPDPVAIARDYAPQFDASEALLQAIWASVPRRGHDGFAVTLMNVLGRSLGTYRALLHLLRGGFTDQAWMLGRPLFEDMIFGYWIALPENRASAVKHVEEHLETTSQRIDYLLARIHDSGFEGLTEPGDPEKDWAGRSSLVRGLNDRVKQIEPLWLSSGGSLPELYVHRDITHWVANLAVHISGSSLRDTLTRGAVKLDHGSVYTYGQSGQVEETQMLYGFEFSAFRVGWLARLVLLEADRPLDELEASYKQLIRAVRELAPSQRAKLGRNDPCWCGSGEKFKKCHGSGVESAATGS